MKVEENKAGLGFMFFGLSLLVFTVAAMWPSQIDTWSRQGVGDSLLENSADEFIYEDLTGPQLSPHLLFPEAPPVTVEDLTGLWAWGPDHYLIFDEDGTYRGIGGLLYPEEVGNFQLRQTSPTTSFIIFDTSWDSLACQEVPGVYEIKLLGPDQLRFELQKDLCGLRRAQFKVVWNRVSP